MCVQGCHDVDPAPDSAGYYLAGYKFTWEGCTNPDIDLDQDGLLDDCEFALAEAFAPLLSFGSVDDVTQEPRWAARWDDGGVVYLAYLLSYWQDNGDTGMSHGWCIAGYLTGCNGHHGDSEYIVLKVKYNFDTHHWYLQSAWFSQHTGGNSYFQYGGAGASPDDNDGHTLEFPDKWLGYPKVWVADGKHANYATQSECADGGTYGSDTCEDDRVEARTFVGIYENVGSSTHHLIDCVQTPNTTHPEYSGHYSECYWTHKPFEGWFAPTVNPGTSSYSDVLLTFEF